MELSLRHILAIEKISRVIGAPMQFAIEKASETASYMFLVTSDLHSISLCIGLAVHSSYFTLDELSTDAYIS